MGSLAQGSSAFGACGIGVSRLDRARIGVGARATALAGATEPPAVAPPATARRRRVKGRAVLAGVKVADSGVVCALGGHTVATLTPSARRAQMAVIDGRAETRPANAARETRGTR